jgi:hypothetical protein
MPEKPLAKYVYAINFEWLRRIKHGMRVLEIGTAA